MFKATDVVLVSLLLTGYRVSAVEVEHIDACRVKMLMQIAALVENVF